LPRLVLGGGSNILFCDDFAGLVVHNGLKGIRCTRRFEHWLLHVAAGENWHSWCATPCNRAGTGWRTWR
jgi:UDP-N-acetylmuramate dehydrogenase